MQLSVIQWIISVACRIIHLTDGLCHAIMTEAQIAVVDRGLDHILGGSIMARGAMFTSVLRAAGNILKPFIPLATIGIRRELVKFFKTWEEHAKSTPNKIDDVIVDIVATLVGIDNVDWENDPE